MSRIRANTITNKAATGAPTFTHGANVTGVCTATSFSGSGANLTSLPAGQLTGALPAISGANLTGISAGLFSSYAIITHEKSNNTHGSSLSNSSYATRELNTEVADPDNIVSVSGNQFTLQAGSYLIESMSIIHRGNQSQSMLYNVSDSSVVQYGLSVHSSDGNSGNVISPVVARVTIGSAKAFSIKSRVSNSDGENSGLANNFGNTQIYSIVKIFKEN